MVAIPPALLDSAEMEAGMEVALTVAEGTISIRSPQRRPALAELIARCNPAEPAGEDEWVHTPAVGEELL